MKHDASIPYAFHVGARDSVLVNLGAFWSSVFKDRDLVDAVLASKALSASQLHVTAMEDLSLRDHTGLPTYHREHWHPLFVRLSQRNMRRGLMVGMEGAVIGPQTDDNTPYTPGEVFEVGENADASKVNAYPFVAMNGCPLVRVRTCVCDSIQSPSHVLVQGRDFELRDGIILVRKEQDPFDRDGYRVVEVEGDRVAVLWVCDGEYDTNNVADFLSYPMGFDVESTDVSRRLLSAYWDAVVHGLAPRYLNTMLGALYDTPTAEGDGVVESVGEDGDDTIVVTAGTVYRIASSRVRGDIVKGAVLRAGDFLTDEIRVYHSFSQTEFAALVDGWAFTPQPTATEPDPLPRVTLPAGSVLGVGVPVRVESFQSARDTTDQWFRLNAGDSFDSPFWTAVRSRLPDPDDRAAFLDTLFRGETEIDPLKTLGYASLANTVIVVTARQLIGTPYARQLFRALQGLMPGFASLLTVDQAVDGTVI